MRPRSAAIVLRGGSIVARVRDASPDTPWSTADGRRSYAPPGLKLVAGSETMLRTSTATKRLIHEHSQRVKADSLAVYEILGSSDVRVCFLKDGLVVDRLVVPLKAGS